MRYIIAALLTLFATFAQAQAPTRLCFSLVNGSTASCVPVDNSNPLPVAATVSASITGFTPNLSFANLTATGSSASVALPTGTSIQFQNTGTTAVSCTLGVGSATAIANEIIIQPGSTKSLTIGSNNFGACIDQTGSVSNLVVLNGGTGLGSDSGGGGSSGGGAVTQGTTPWVDLLTPALKGPKVYVNVNSGTGATPITLPAGSTSTYPVICLVPVLPQSDVYYELGNPAPTAITGTSSHLGVTPICQGYTGDTSITAVAASPGTVEVTQWSAYPTFGAPVATYPSLSPYGAQIFNLVSINNSAPIFGVGPSAAGVMRVALSNDSPVLIWNGINTLDVLAPSTLPLATNRAMPVSLMPNSPGIITFGSQADTLAVPILQTPTANATSAMSHASTTALGTSLVVKATPGNLYGFNCTGITGGAAGFCIMYNGTTAPSTGALTGANVIDICEFDTSARGCSLSRIPMTINYGTGMVLLVTTAASPYTYTTGTATAALTADYK